MEYLTELRANQNCKVKDHECKIKKRDIVIIHDDKKSRALWSIAKVEKVLLSNDNKVRGATIKYFINGKAVVINRPIYKLYPTEPVKQTSADIQPKFVDDTKIYIYVYIYIGSVVPWGEDVVYYT